MGIIVSDDYTFDTGLSITEYYVNIDNINIKKSGAVTDFKYTVHATWYCYTSKANRDNFKKHFNAHELVIPMSDINNLHEQIYTELKTKFENYTDDL